MGPILIYNSQVSSIDIGDSRGVAYVRASMQEILELLGCRTPEEGAQKISELMESIGCATRLRDLGIHDSHFSEYIAENVNLQRMGNNPRALGKEPLNRLLELIV